MPKFYVENGRYERVLDSPDFITAVLTCLKEDLIGTNKPLGRSITVNERGFITNLLSEPIEGIEDTLESNKVVKLTYITDEKKLKRIEKIDDVMYELNKRPVWSEDFLTKRKMKMIDCKRITSDIELREGETLFLPLADLMKMINEETW